MPTPLAYLNGQLIPASQAALRVYDAGFVLGVTVAEQVRTFAGRLFRLQQHLTRLSHSVDIIGIDPGVSMSKLEKAAVELAEQNHALLDEGDDLGLSIFITPGPYSTMAAVAGGAGEAGPTVCMHTYPLPFHLYADKYEHGQSLVVSDVQQVPAACWPPELKCRSRMHYYLADAQARRVRPDARALLLDCDGHVLEASTANIVIYNLGEGIVSPPKEKILPGVSVGMVAELAAESGIPFLHRDLSVDDVLQADEVMLCSTSPCVWPVVDVDGRPIADGKPGAMTTKLLAAWSDAVGVDIKTQAKRFSTR
ncbi:MAG: aminotransferase class IV [Planctomycetes bacterium]|nr:aminotransferase class IV [Planctomycetota bacterium]MBL7041230.1 aminotransferase class IV [Pirellulaceae bacterium]